MMTKVLVMFALLTSIAFDQAHADFVSTDCKKWSDEGVGLFECSNEKAYAVGLALCKTIDSRRNGKANTSHPEQPTEIFCRWRLREDVTRCLNDGDEEVVACFKEYQSRGGATKAPKSVNSKTSH